MSKIKFLPLAMSLKLSLTLIVMMGTIVVLIGATPSSASQSLPIGPVIPTLGELGIQLEDIPVARPLSPDTVISSFASNQSQPITLNTSDHFPLEPFAPTGHLEMFLFSDTASVAVGPGDFLIGYNNYGIFSTNRGLSWRPIEGAHSSAPFVNYVAMPPNANEPIFVVTGDGWLLRSIDYGQTWERVGHNHPVYQIQQSLYSPTYHADNLIFAVGTNATSALILARSVNKGESWSSVPLPDYLPKIALPPDFVNSQIIVAHRYNAVYHSSDGGYGWQLANEGLHIEYNNAVSEIIFSPGHASDSVAFAITSYGIYKSLTNGRNWWRALPFQVKKMVLHPDYPYTPTFFIIATVQVDDQQFDALLRTDDDGQTFQGLAANVVDFALSSQYPSNHSLYAMVPEGLIFSNNNGATWYIHSRSIGASWPTQIIASPAVSSDGAVYLLTTTATGGGYHHTLWRSNSLGVAWQKIPIPRPDSVTVRLAISPDFANDQTLILQTLKKPDYFELHRSTDRGDSWQLLSDSVPDDSGWHKALFHLSPNYAQDQTIFTVNFDEGLKRSQNNGQTWQTVYATPPGRIADFAIAPEYPADNRLILSVAGIGLLRSDNGGVNWSALTNPSFSGEYKIALSTNFKNDQTLFAIETHSGGYIWRSEDAGNSWVSVENSQMHYFNQEFVVSSQYDQDQTAVTIVGNRGVFMTEDGGDHWFALSGLEQPDNLVTIAQWQGRPYPLVLDRTGYYIYLWPEQTSAGFSCQNLLLDSEDPQWATIVASASGGQPVGWHIRNLSADWLSLEQSAGVMPEYAQALINTAGMTEPTQATLELDVYLSYRQKQTHTISAFAPCFGQNLPLVSHRR